MQIEHRYVVQVVYVYQNTGNAGNIGNAADTSVHRKHRKRGGHNITPETPDTPETGGLSDAPGVSVVSRGTPERQEKRLTMPNTGKAGELR